MSNILKIKKSKEFYMHVEYRHAIFLDSIFELNLFFLQHLLFINLLDESTEWLQNTLPSSC